MFRREKKKMDLSHSNNRSDFNDVRKTIRELIAPHGADNTNPEFFIIHDSARNFYYCTMYLHKLPTKTTFADFYASLSSFPGTITNIHIEPISPVKMQQMIDTRVTSSSMAATEAEQKGSRLDVIKASKKMNESENFADYILSGNNALYEVQFMYTIIAQNTEDLTHLLDSFVSLVRRKNADAVSCYCMQEEAFKSTLPLNRIVCTKGLNNIAKKHILEKASLGDIFSHTSNKFFHKKGVYLGHYIDDSSVFLYDVFDSSHSAYNFIVAGMTGTGKSMLVKLLFGRNADFGMRFRILDVQGRFSKGEYSDLCTACGGITFTIKSIGQGTTNYNILNPFELVTETEYDEASDVEYETLKLNEKITYLQGLIMSMISFGTAGIDVELAASLVRIVTDMVRSLYADLGIEEGKPQSLYTSIGGTGLLNSGKNRKPMPTFSDAYRKILVMQRNNTIENHVKAYQVIIDVLGTYVRGVFYGERTLRFYSEEEYQAFPVNPATGCRERRELSGATERVIAVKGTRTYFDGQSTIRADHDTPFIDYDISQLPPDEIPFAMLACLGYIEQHDLRSNSSNPRKMKPMCFFIDELHLTFSVPGAPEIIDMGYRTARKRWISMGVATQSIADFGRTETLMGIFKNSPTLFLLRHKSTDREFIKKNTDLNSAQIERIFSLGYVEDMDDENNPAAISAKRGEVCVQDVNRVAFVKVDYIKEIEQFFAETNMQDLKNSIQTTA